MERIEIVEEALRITNDRLTCERTIPLFKTTKDELEIVIDGLLDLYSVVKEIENDDTDLC